MAGTLPRPRSVDVDALLGDGIRVGDANRIMVLRARLQQVVDEERDPELSCLEARHLLERKLKLPIDGLLGQKAAVVEAWASIESPGVSLSPGEIASHAIAYTFCGAFYWWRWSMPARLFS